VLFDEAGVNPGHQQDDLVDIQGGTGF